MSYGIKKSKQKTEKESYDIQGKDNVYILSYASAEDMGIKPNDSLIGTTYNLKTKEITGYVHGYTFKEEDDVKFSPKIKTFVIIDKEGNETPVYAVDAEIAKKTLGYGNSYEEEYGDYAGLIQQLKSNEAEIYRVEKAKYIPVEKSKKTYNETKTPAFTQKEIEVDNSIFQIADKGSREDKIRLLKILKNRTKQLEGGLKE